MKYWRAAAWPVCAVVGVVLALDLGGCSRASSGTASSWNPRTAAAYLDQRED